MSLPAGFTTRPELSGSFGMAAASHWLAAASAMSMLERGGNAFDGAVAAGFVLEVVEPHQNGPGGEAPMVLWSAADRRAFVVNGQGPAPAAATAQRFADLGLDLVPGTGLLAACVPAALGSWLFVLQRFGTMSLREVLEPALGYASAGFPVLASLAGVLGDVARLQAARWPTTAAQWLAGGVPSAGSRFTNPSLAAFYERLLAESESGGAGRDAQLDAALRAVYEGFVAETAAEFARVPVADELGVHAGLIAADDFATWRPSLEEPVRGSYRGVEVLKTPTWGQGPVLLQQLAMLEGLDVASLAPGGAELVHVVTESAKLALADREAWYGDPAVVDVPLETLLSGRYAADRRELIGAQASYELRPGSPDGREPRLPAMLARLVAAGADPYDGLAHHPGELAGGSRGESPAGDGPGGGWLAANPADVAINRGDTCHVDVVDRFGNLISATPSGGWLQGSPAIPGLGFCLGTRAQMFWLEQGLASSLAPGKRPRSTLSPALVLRDGKPGLAFGTPGGDQQDQWTVPFLLYHLDFGYGLQAAIDAANWHSTHAPSSFFPREARPGELVAEASLGPEVLDELRRRGHRVATAAAMSMGRVTAVGLDRDGLLAAGADPRNGQAYAVGR